MSRRDIAKTDPELVDQAKALYMQYVAQSEIARRMKLSLTVISDWSKKGEWVSAREESERSLLEDAFAGRRVSISRILKATTEQIELGLSHLKTRPTPPTIAEVERLSVILANLDKISRLDSNKATENIAVQTNIRLSADQIREIVKSDPFFPHE